MCRILCFHHQGRVFFPCLIVALLLTANTIAFSQQNSLATTSSETLETNKAIYTLRELGRRSGRFETTQDHMYVVTEVDAKRFECTLLGNSEKVLGTVELSGAPLWRLYGDELLIANEIGWKTYKLPELRLERSVDKRTLTSDPDRKGDVSSYPNINGASRMVRLSNGWSDGVYVWDSGATRITAIVAAPFFVADSQDKACEWRSLNNDSIDLFQSLELIGRSDIGDRGHTNHEQWPFEMEGDPVAQGVRLRFFDLLRFKKPLRSAIFFRSSGNDITFVNDNVGFLITIDRIKDSAKVEHVGFVRVQPDFIFPSKKPWNYRLVNSDEVCSNFDTTPHLLPTAGIDFTALNRHPMQDLARVIDSPDWNRFQARTNKYIRAVSPEFERVVGFKPMGFPFPFVVVAKHHHLRFKHVVWSDIPMEGLVAEFLRQTLPDSIKAWQQIQAELIDQKSRKVLAKRDKSNQSEQEIAKKIAEEKDLEAAAQLIQESSMTFHVVVFGLALLGTVGLVGAAFIPKLRMCILLVMSLSIQCCSLFAQGVRMEEGAEYCELQYLPIPGILALRTDPYSDIACVLMEKKTGSTEIGIVNLTTGKAIKKFNKPDLWNFETSTISSKYVVSLDHKKGHVFQLDSGKLVRSFEAIGAQQIQFLKPEVICTRDAIIQIPSFVPIDFQSDQFCISSLHSRIGKAAFPMRSTDGMVELNGYVVDLVENEKAGWLPHELSNYLIEPAKVNIAWKQDKDGSKKKRSTEIAISAMRSELLFVARGVIAIEADAIQRAPSPFSGGVAQACSTGLLILRWKPDALSLVSPTRVIVDKVPVVSNSEKQVEIDARLESDMGVIRIGNESQSPSPRFKAKLDLPRLNLADIAKVLLRESVSEFPTSIEQLVQAYRSANHSWIEIIERRNQTPLVGLPILLNVTARIELVHGGDQMVKLPCVIQIDDLNGLRSQFGDLFKDDDPAVDGQSELVASANFQFPPIAPSNELRQAEIAAEQASMPKLPIIVESVVHIETARNQIIKSWTRLFVLLFFGFVGLPLAMRYGLYLTIPTGSANEGKVSWWRLLAIGVGFVCFKPLTELLLGYGVSAVFTYDSPLALLILLPLRLSIAYVMLFGIACLVCKAHFGRLANALLATLVILFLTEVPGILRVIAWGMG